MNHYFADEESNICYEKWALQMMECVQDVKLIEVNRVANAMSHAMDMRRSGVLI
jgi:hypothetical protein